MFPSNVTGISCPGCGPNDFPVQHICGQGNATASVSLWNGPICWRCGQQYIDVHNCPMSTATGPIVTPQSTPIIPPATATCEHCWCIEQKAGSHRVPDRSNVFGYENRQVEAHDICCGCGSRRLKVGATDDA